MSYGKYQISTLGETFKLQYRHQKYWEIKYEQKKGSVIINCGKLLPDNKVDPDTLLTLSKKFTALVQIKDFINKHINIKISKGYKFLRDNRSTAPTRKTSEEITTAPSEQSNLTKRHNPNLNDPSLSSLPGSEPTKAIHTDPFGSFTSTGSTKASTDYSRSQENSFSASYPPNKTPSGKTNPPTISKDMMKEEAGNSLKPPSMMQIMEMSTSKKDYSSQIKEDDESINQLKSPGSEFKAVDIEQKREEFMKKVEALTPEECPFGKPTYGSHGTITTASKWESEDPKGWFISEKLGGIRCLWNGLEMWSKNGTQYNIPDYFVEKLPKSPLDGELYMERGTLSKCMMIVKKKSTDPDYNKEWNNMWFVVYDAPEAQGNFKQRLQLLKDYFGSRQETLYVRLHEYTICGGKQDAQRQLEQIQKEGGEGIVLREPNSPYTKGRSKFVLERRSHFEAIADVIEHIKGKSKNGAEIVASLRVRTSDGKEFLINRGITDDIRQHPPAVGSQIIYKFSGELDSGKPKAPVFIKAADKESSS